MYPNAANRPHPDPLLSKERELKFAAFAFTPLNSEAKS